MSLAKPSSVPCKMREASFPESISVQLVILFLVFVRVWGYKLRADKLKYSVLSVCEMDIVGRIAFLWSYLSPAWWDRDLLAGSCSESSVSQAGDALLS